MRCREAAMKIHGAGVGSCVYRLDFLDSFSAFLIKQKSRFKKEVFIKPGVFFCLLFFWAMQLL
jgi:hypothetical protein